MNLNRSSKIAVLALLMAQGFVAGAQTNSTDAPVDFSTVSKFIADRNIFDPNRVAHVPFRPHPVTSLPPVARQPDSFSLVGIIGYGEGRLAGVYAFFDGSSQEYRKSAQVNDSIATFKVSAIGPDSVTLVSNTNTTVLRIGQSLRDAGGGHWLSSSETSARYDNSGGRNSGRNRSAGGNRRRNNNSGNFNSGNFTRNRNSFGTSDNSQNSQPDDTSMVVPQDANMIIPDDSAAPDDTTASNDPTMPDNTTVPETDASPSAAPGDPNDPTTILQQRRAQELQQIGQ